MKIYLKTIKGSPFFICLLLLSACISQDKREEQERSTDSTAVVSEAPVNNELKVKQIKQIFYTLPSPMEISLLFKREGVQYYPDRLLPPDRHDKYLLSTKRALILGVYGADLSYAGLFSKHEDAIEYFRTCQLIADDLGVGKVFEKDFISRLERNAGSRDTLLQVISDFFLDNDSYLKDTKHQTISTYVLTGGWIEGLYLGTMMTDFEDGTQQGIMKVIAGQKYSLENLLDLYKHIEDEGSFNNMKAQLEELHQLYEGIDYPAFIKEAKRSGNIDTNEKYLYLYNDHSDLEISLLAFQAIKNKIAVIRNSIVAN
jgi:hypothetical protein